MMLIELGRGMRPLKPAQNFTPAKLSGLIGWYDAADAATITAASSLVSNLADKSSASNHLVGLSNNKPITGALTQNGLNLLNFNDPTYAKFLSLTGASSGGALSGLSSIASTIAVTFKQNTTASNGAILSVKSTINADAFVPDLGSSNRGYFPQSTGASFMNLNPTTMPRGSAYCVVFRWSPAGITCHVNGVLQGSDTLASANYIDRFVLGYRCATSMLWRGAIGEVCVINRGITDAERVSLQNYLMTKWGIA